MIDTNMVYDDGAHHIEECMDHARHAHLHDPRGLSMSSPHLFLGLPKLCSCDHVSIEVAKRQWFILALAKLAFCLKKEKEKKRKKRETMAIVYGGGVQHNRVLHGPGWACYKPGSLGLPIP